MTTRTTRTQVTFRHPFALAGCDGQCAAGTYVVETDEERLPTVLTSGYRRVSTTITLVPRTDNPRITETVVVDPEELDAALLRDTAPPATCR